MTIVTKMTMKSWRRRRRIVAAVARKMTQSDVVALQCVVTAGGD